MRDQTLQFKCTVEERAQIVEQAKKENFSNFSDWARKVLLDRRGRIRESYRPMKPANKE